MWLFSTSLQDGVRDEASGQAVGLRDVLDEEVFRRARDPRPPIRQAAYELITVLSRHASFCLEAIPAGRLGNHIAQFTREKHLPCMEKMMLALLALVRAYPQLWGSGMRIKFNRCRLQLELTASSRLPRLSWQPTSARCCCHLWSGK